MSVVPTISDDRNPVIRYRRADTVPAVQGYSVRILQRHYDDWARHVAVLLLEEAELEGQDQPELKARLDQVRRALSDAEDSLLQQPRDSWSDLYPERYRQVLACAEVFVSKRELSSVPEAIADAAMETPALAEKLLADFRP